jgi:fluoride exporter
VRELLAVAAGGAIGAGLRYGVGLWMSRAYSGFPWHTMLVNVLGSFLIGVLMALSVDKGAVSGEWRLFLGTGVLGGFTTFSTLAYESVAMASDGLMLPGLANVVLTCVVGLGMAWVGLVVGRAL